MRTNIDLDEALMTEALELTGLPTKKAVVEKALQDLVGHLSRKKAWEELRGMGWEGDLEEMRRDIDPEADEKLDAAE